MIGELRVLHVEDVATDSDLALRQLKRAGLRCHARRVETEAELRAALADWQPDVVLSDFSLPHFDGMSALALTREVCPATPFIFVSGTLGEETAIEALKRGATDYVLKTNLARLPTAVERAVREARERMARDATERELAETNSRLESIFASLGDVLWSSDPTNGEILYLNSAVVDVYGYPPEAFLEEPGLRLRLIHPEDRARVEREWSKVAAGFRFQCDYRIVRRDGATRWIADCGRLVQGPGGVPRIDGIARDITERHLQEAKIQRLNRVHAMLSGINATILRIRDRAELLNEACRIAVHDGGFRMAWIGQVDADAGRVAVAASAGVEDGYLAKRFGDPGALRDDPSPMGVLIREHRAAVCNDVANDIAMRAWRNEALNRGYRSVAAFPLMIGERLFGAMGLYAEEPGVFDDEEVELLEALAGDVSFAVEHIEKEEQLHFLAYFDPLTSLPNRRLFEDRVTQAIAAARHDGETVAVVFADLERFRSVNDTFGRHAGDKLLRDVANRLSASIAESESVARVSSDCFAGLFTTFGRAEQVALDLQRRLASCLLEPFEVEGERLNMAFRCGVAFFPADGEDADQLFRNAEAALKHAKSMNEAVVLYTRDLNARVAEQLTIESKLRRALDEDRFVLHYQPKIALGSGELCGFEALMRWQDPELGLVPPARFIGILEETGLILEVGRWAMRKAAEVSAQWARDGFAPMRIAVNVSPIQLRQKNFVASVAAAVAVAASTSHGIDLEITESVIMRDIEANIVKLRAVREMGVGIAIDDFGTGYSSLAYVAKLPITVIKVDRTFVSGLESDRDSRTIVALMINLAHSLDLAVIAEGVETVEQARPLRTLKCNTYQGFLFSPALPAEQIGTLRRKIAVNVGA